MLIMLTMLIILHNIYTKQEKNSVDFETDSRWLKCIGLSVIFKDLKKCS